MQGVNSLCTLASKWLENTFFFFVCLGVCKNEQERNMTEKNEHDCLPVYVVYHSDWRRRCRYCSHQLF